MYRLLVGQAPYTTQSLAMMLATVREGGWDLQSLENCPVPEELKAICRKALNFDPDQRFRSAESLATALDHFASATTRIEGAGSTIPATQGPAGRSSVRKLAVSLGVVLVAFALGLAFVLYASRGPLPSFDAWQNELVAANWPSPEINGNWVYRAGQLQAIENSLSARPLTRGEVRQTKTPTPFKQWCDSLRQAEGTDVRGVTFVVQPKS